jgi:hypothetical protein
MTSNTESDGVTSKLLCVVVRILGFTCLGMLTSMASLTSRGLVIPSLNFLKEIIKHGSIAISFKIKKIIVHHESTRTSPSQKQHM